MKLGKKKLSAVSILKAVSQILFFIFLPSLYISTLDGIKQIYIDIINRSFNFETLLPQIITAIAIVPATVLAGRFFCGWMCAFGAFLDFVYAVSKKLFGLNLKVSRKADKALKYLKYALLLFLIIAVWSFGAKTFSTSNPWDAFGMLLTIGKAPDFSYVISNLLPAFIIFVLTIAVSAFYERFFCRYLCPLGAVFAITSKFRITSILKRNDKCGKCRICTNACPMGLPLYEKSMIKSGECINCFKCVCACPRKNVSLAVSEKDVRPLIAGTVAVAAMTGIYYAGSIADKAVANKISASQTIASAPESSGSSSSTSSAVSKSPGLSSSAATSASKYTDGTYSGTGAGFRGSSTTVSVTVKNGRISDVKAVSYGDDEQFFDRAYPTIAQSVLNKQSADVDTVSGATYSSRGIMEAVSNALSKAAKS